eukprot:1195713-Prorocentrum_minimum.AAC.4
MAFGASSVMIVSHLSAPRSGADDANDEGAIRTAARLLRMEGRGTMGVWDDEAQRGFGRTRHGERVRGPRLSTRSTAPMGFPSFSLCCTLLASTRYWQIHRRSGELVSHAGRIANRKSQSGAGQGGRTNGPDQGGREYLWTLRLVQPTLYDTLEIGPIGRTRSRVARYTSYEAGTRFNDCVIAPAAGGHRCDTIITLDAPKAMQV